TSTHPLSRHQGSSWMQNEPPVTGAWLDYQGGDPLGSTSLLSTGLTHASMLVERTHPTAPIAHRVRYDRYLLARMSDGRTFQAGPDKDVQFDSPNELRHHLPSRPSWLNALYGRSTSTGW